MCREIEMVEVTVKAQGNQFKQEINTSAHVFTSDAPTKAGGEHTAPEPHELLLGALGACTSITMQMYAKHKGYDLKNIEINLSEEEIEDPDHPGQKISKISRDIKVEGNLAQDQLEGLKRVADKCPIHKLLNGPKKIATTIAQLN